MLGVGQGVIIETPSDVPASQFGPDPTIVDDRE